ncbi:hypothetical protein BMS3Bbin04_00088 [bacterium BMS3Bbin04]|nr:hypothetical protein BMS3Bbin04_00088 [bacterium BMS3Bbin04]
MKRITGILLAGLIVLIISAGCESEDNNVTTPDNTELPDISGYPVVGTNQTAYYDTENEIAEPTVGAAYYGQDAQYISITPEYVDNGDGTIIDMVTGLMW